MVPIRRTFTRPVQAPVRPEAGFTSVVRATGAKKRPPQPREHPESAPDHPDLHADPACSHHRSNGIGGSWSLSPEDGMAEAGGDSGVVSAACEKCGERASLASEGLTGAGCSTVVRRLDAALAALQEGDLAAVRGVLEGLGAGLEDGR